MPPADATRSIALLGPTNTGKTHRAVERMLEHRSGMLGLPLRLLAREIYDRVTARIGEDRVALVTGEEKRLPPRPDYWICTTEAMPLTREVDFLAVDEIQLATHEERGHVFTDRLLHARGRKETWFLGAGTMREVLARVVPAARQEEHPRLSRLCFAGSSKLSRLRPRSAVVAFSLRELYSWAERLRTFRGGTAVVLGALSPRARNAQVALFQAGEVDYLVATDAIGMGLNLDLQHVAFGSLRKFDGQKSRALDGAEIAQIAGRAGRFTRDGSFGTVLPLELEHATALRVEGHQFDPVRRLRFRNSALDFSSARALLESLRLPPKVPYFMSVSAADDVRALESLLRLPEIQRELQGPRELELLWEVCRIPDFRHILFEVHVDLLRQLFTSLVQGPLGDDSMASHYAELDRVDGDVDTLMARIARLRTWAFVTNQSAWVDPAPHWQGEFSSLEDRLSDALHNALVQRFVERRARTPTARPTTRKAPLSAIEDPAGYRPFASLEALRERLLPASTGLVPSANQNLAALSDATHEAFVLTREGAIAAQGAVLGKLFRGSAIALPEVRLVGLDELGAGLRSRLARRLQAFARDLTARLLLAVRELGRSDLGALRAIAYQLEQGLGTALRRDLIPSLATLGEAGERELAAQGVTLGAFSLFLPSLLRPAAVEQRAILLSVYEPKLSIPPKLGHASYPSATLNPSAWLALGYIALGPRALRVDLAERLRDEPTSQENQRTLAALGVPRQERARVTRALAGNRSAARDERTVTPPVSEARVENDRNAGAAK